MKLIKLSDLDALDILELDSRTSKQSIYPSIFSGMWFQREAHDPPTRMAPGNYLFTTLGFVFSSRGVDVSGSMPFCVELDNLKDTDAPIHQPAAMLVAAN